MVKIKGQPLLGRWLKGYALDMHMEKVVYLCSDEFGEPIYDKTRAEVGELLYRLKYRGDQSTAPQLIKAAFTAMSKWNPSAAK